MGIDKLADLFMKYGEKGGLLFVCLVLMFFLGLEIKRGAAKDKIIALKDAQNLEFQNQILILIGELKTASSNNLLLLEMLTRGRK